LNFQPYLTWIERKKRRKRVPPSIKSLSTGRKTKRRGITNLFHELSLQTSCDFINTSNEWNQNQEDRRSLRDFDDFTVALQDTLPTWITEAESQSQGPSGSINEPPNRASALLAYWVLTHWVSSPIRLPPISSLLTHQIPRVTSLLRPVLDREMSKYHHRGLHLIVIYVTGTALCPRLTLAPLLIDSLYPSNYRTAYRIRTFFQHLPDSTTRRAKQRQG
jgi:hypothetical protein